MNVSMTLTGLGTSYELRIALDSEHNEVVLYLVDEDEIIASVRESRGGVGGRLLATWFAGDDIIIKQKGT